MDLPGCHATGHGNTRYVKTFHVVNHVPKA